MFAIFNKYDNILQNYVGPRLERIANNMPKGSRAIFFVLELSNFEMKRIHAANT